jgi:hypothetical protein
MAVKYGYFSNGYQPNYVHVNNKFLNLVDTKLTAGETGLKGTLNSAGKSIDNQAIYKTSDPDDTNYYVWIGNGSVADSYGNKGRYVAIPKDQIMNTALKTDFQNTVDIKTRGETIDPLDYFSSKLKQVEKETKKQSTKVTTPSYSAPKAYDITKDPNYKNAMDRIKELEEAYAEATRVWTADEVAKHLGLEDQYNKDNILKMLNEQTNEYYDDAVAEQQTLRNDYVKNNAQYINQLTDSYIDSTKYTAPTATNRGIQAANLMTTSMNADTTNSMNDYGMYQNILNQEESRKAELANNDWLATQKYNGLGTALSNWSATKNTSDVQQYVDDLKSATNYYAADRAYLAYLSQANAQKYAGLAGASQNNAYNAAQAANSQAGTFQNLWNYYYNVYNKSDTAATNKVASLLESGNSQ